MRVGLFSTGFPALRADGTREPGRRYGGVQACTEALARALAARGHEVHVFTTGRGGDRAWGGLHVHELPPRLRVGRTAIAPSLVGAPARRHPGLDVAVAMMGTQPAPLGAWRYARRHGVPFVLWHHGAWQGGFGGPLRRLGVAAQRRALEPFLLDRADRVVVLSGQARDAHPALRARAAKCSTIPNGVDLGAFAVAGGRAGARARLGLGEEPVVLFVGSLSPIKGVDVLLEAWGRLAVRVPDARLLVVGGGARAPYGRQAARGAGADRVRFLGFVDDAAKADALAAADALAMPSRTEAYPLVALEAGAAGLPVVASAIPPLEALVEDGVNGLLVPPEDPGALAAALERLLGDAGLRRRLGAANRLRASALGWDEVARRFEALLEGVAAARAAR